MLAALTLVVASAAVIVGLRFLDPAGPQESARSRTFGDLMRPYGGVADAETVTATHRARRPAWPEHEVIPWDREDAFTYSLTPRRLGTYISGGDVPANGGRFETAEFHSNSAFPKNSDVTFTVTGRRFAIRYVTFARSDAMVWIDGRSVATQPFTSVDARGKGTDDWIVIELSEARTVDVRFAGPYYFSGIEFPADEEVSVSAAPPRYTVGVVADSYYEPSPDPRSMSTSAAPSLSTLTGFRVWNMAQGGTGYLNHGSNPLGETFDDVAGTSAYGSDDRIDAVADAPIDALLVNGSINDVGFSLAEHRDAVDRFLTRIEERAHSVPIVLIGLEPLSTSAISDEPIDQFVTMTGALKDMAAKHPNVVGFIDPYTPNWLTGTGSTNAPTGTGNQDEYIGIDGIHPNGAGQMFYQQRIVAELRKLPVDPSIKSR